MSVRSLSRHPVGIGADLFPLERRRCEHERADRRAQFVARHLVERLDPGVAIVDRGHVFADERIDGRAHHRARRPRQPAQELETLGRRRLETEPLRLLGDEGLEDVGEDLVFLQELMDRCLLLMPEDSQLASFFDHDRVGGDLFFVGRPQVRRDLSDQGRDVIQQLGGREYLVGLDREDLVETPQPSFRQRVTLSGDTLRHDSREILGGGNSHRNLLAKS
jgi:hypothetical protein